MSNKIPPEARWTAEARKQLVGRKITDVSYMSNAEAQECGWSYRPLCITLDDGSQIFPMADEEGNDGGVLATSNELCPLLPSLFREG